MATTGRTWPATLPQQFERRSYRDSLPEQLRRSGLRGGERTFREAVRSQIVQFRGSVLVTTAQWNTLLSFYDITLGAGSLSFDMPDVDDNSEMMVVVFQQPPQLRHIGGSFHSVQLSLRRLS